MDYFKRNNTKMVKNFNKLLKQKLQDKNLSEISRDLGIPRSILQDWVHENREPSMKSLKYVKRIADFLGYSLEWRIKA